MQILVDFWEWISKINLIDISIFIFYIINAGLIIFFIIKGIKALRKLYKKDNLKKQKVDLFSKLKAETRSLVHRALSLKGVTPSTRFEGALLYLCPTKSNFLMLFQYPLDK